MKSYCVFGKRQIIDNRQLFIILWFFNTFLFLFLFTLLFLYTILANILIGNTILVRELWFGNLPENIQEKKLRNTVEMFGDVENIEFFNKVSKKYL